jgi:hypothetical protein
VRQRVFLVWLAAARQEPLSRHRQVQGSSARIYRQVGIAADHSLCNARGNIMADDAKKAAAVLWRYMVARVRFRRGSLTGLSTSALDYQIKHGVRLFSDGILIDLAASPVITHDDKDPNFLAAIKGQDDAIEMTAADLNMYRKFVLHGEGALPMLPTRC